MPVVAVKAPPLQTTVAADGDDRVGRAVGRHRDGAGGAGRRGHVHAELRRCRSAPAQSTAMLPCGVGTLPSAQLRSPGCGCDGPGGVAGGGRLHAEDVAGQRRDGRGGPAVGEAARRAESDLAVGGGDVLPHGAGVVGVARVDHVAPHGLEQRLGVGGVVRRQARVHLVAGDVGADDAGVGAAGERLGAVGSGPQVGLERRQERGVIRRPGRRRRGPRASWRPGRRCWCRCCSGSTGRSSCRRGWR